MLKAAIFDMDGLLIDSEPYWRQAHIQVLGKYGYKITEEDARTGAGKRTPDQVLVWQERFKWQDLSNDQLVNEITETVVKLIKLNASALPGTHRLIDILKKNHVPMAVASSSSETIIKEVLGHLGIEKDFRFAYSAENEKRGKPFPDVFLSTAKRLRVAPSQCIVFEDSLNGVKAAKAAGMKCIAIPEIMGDQANFKHADLVLSSLEEVDWPTIKAMFES